MDTIYQYVKWLGNYSFEETPFCTADALVLCNIVYYDFKLFDRYPSAPSTLRELCRRVVSERKTQIPYCGINNKETSLFIEAAAQSKRFGDLTVRDYSEKLDHNKAIQFAAMTFDCKDLFSFIAYRGTDDTLAGWKEDFMISFTQTAAQKLALSYANRQIRPGVKNYIGGHSKGANLALYAACLLDSELWYSEVEQVYLLDGPGLCKEVMDTSVAQRVYRRCTRIIPEFSVIGKLFEPKAENTIIVKSTAEGAMQHDLNTWGIEYGEPATAKRNDPKSEELNDVIDKWIENVGQRERKIFVDDLFNSLTADGSATIGDVSEKGIESIENLIVKMLGYRHESKKTIGSLAGRAAFGGMFHRISQMGLLNWIGQNTMAKGIVLLIFGAFFVFASENILNIAAMLFFITLAVAEIGFTVKRLIRSHGNFAVVKERLYLCIILTVTCITVFFKENAMFMFGSIIFAVLAFVFAFQSGAKVADRKSPVYMRVIHAAEAAFCAIFGASFLVIPQATVYAYSISIGITMIIDGVLRIAVPIILRLRKPKKTGRKH